MTAVQPTVLSRCRIIYSFFEISWGLAGNTAHVLNMSPVFQFGFIVMREFCAEVSDEEAQKQFKGLASSLFSHTIWWSVAENIIKVLYCFSKTL